LTYRKAYVIIEPEKIVKLGGGHMLAVNYTNLRDNMKENFDKITDDFETMIVTRKNNKNIVMMSEESYNNLIENIYVMNNKNNYDWLMESKKQLESGNISTKELIEVSTDE
jgi:antitoxin YefM